MTWRWSRLSRVSLVRAARKACVLLAVLVLALAFAPRASSWGTSVHHDRATTLHRALRESPSIPKGVKENIDFDTIYMAITAPDEWRDATSVAGTYQWNMADNARDEFGRIHDAWAAGDYDNAVYRIGVTSHYVGDAMEMEHNENLRRYYREYIEPLGSEEPLWSDEESGGKLYPHHVRQQIEAYTDSDSAWYPLKPENYGPDDDGSLDYFLDYFENVMDDHIRQTNPYVGPENRWFYWVDTRDDNQAKMDADNDMRLTYNGVYRALRDGYISRGGSWDWPTKGTWLSPRTYGNGYDTIRWWEGQTSQEWKGGTYLSGFGIAGQGLLAPQEYRSGLLGQEAAAQGDSGTETFPSALLVVGLTLLVLSLWCARRSQ